MRNASVVNASTSFACTGGLSFRQIHFVDLSMECAAADAELFGSGGYVAVRRCERLGNQSSFGLVQIERACSFHRKPGELKLLSLSDLLRGDPDSITMTAW